MMRSLISNDAHIQDIALATLYGGFSGDYVKNKMNVIKRLTQNDIKAVCREIFDYTKMGLISIGDYANVNATSNKITNMVDSYYGSR
jgi:phosphoribosylformylglycinamidine (FGAM) synthase-like amidotransferase family enzyme